MRHFELFPSIHTGTIVLIVIECCPDNLWRISAATKIADIIVPNIIQI